jgi:hypothetical protein
MRSDDFFRIADEARKAHPLWFELEADPPASLEKVAAAQGALRATLPPEYVEFVQRYGGGHWAFVQVFSAEPGSEWNVVERNHEAGLLPLGFLAVSDNGAGDFYGFKVVEGVCTSGVVFWDHEEGGALMETGFKDFFKYLVARGLRSDAVSG